MIEAESGILRVVPLLRTFDQECCRQSPLSEAAGGFVKESLVALSLQTRTQKLGVDTQRLL